MKRTDPENADELRSGCEHSDIARRVRRKNTAPVEAETSVVVFKSKPTGEFPNDVAVTKYLRGLNDLSEAMERLMGRPANRGKKRRAK